ncbi:MAG: HIT domain-containing protein [Porticoccaceae bacterium]|nr:HIT domain-containing protein [Porticoccaceae bacterium]
MFKLNPVLQSDTFCLGEFELSLVLLSLDAHYPWVILVPKRHDITEIYQLNVTDRLLLLDESCLLANAMQQEFSPDKLNIATIGNNVPQLHMHHVCRYKSDISWPNPVWGQAPSLSYEHGALAAMKQRLRSQLGGFINIK